ncbi:GNAT family N-acetyltransferase [Francisella orientalis]|uniref:GNAT family N-acetyltransferase n=1 Tax=Francisella orientalis TaxID=299583 RepID=A0AAP6X9Z3_9GAMM|nr:GNAT family N-acetyltransferase [Francisella orientalis]AFJ43441.1 ribosomal-protein-alanine acetyltransferase [Francisella orientalis str. Toba 04]AHB98461.1 alanine acetyltransferase [Francisella orientalis LADL 07-285A]AKN85664.1 Ribosomal-protein-alanine acetyltransferase [Francisella orientalis FNO12]AKN87204.1 Ribosomal-protein-alanine acetyltransferase [Francisella orientalis FNO24]AKN88741.1 Ribosomal-protein-alanine acetyltransferase [Francisella orientalis]
MQILELDITFLTKTIQLVRAIDKDFSWSDKQIEDSLTNDTVLGLMIDSELVAIAIFNYIFETAELLYICVDTAMQSRGVASKLLKYSIDHLGKKEVKELFLEVDINNTKAISLYNKLNFIKVSQRKNYYKKIDGSLSNALICRLDISN